MKNKILCTVIFVISVISFLTLYDLCVNTTNKKADIVEDTTEEVPPTVSVTTTTTTTTRTFTTKKTTTTSKIARQDNEYVYTITHYGPDCKACSGTTVSGYNVKNTIYYNDKTYGKVRIVAIKDLPLYSIVKINDYVFGGDIIAIVLDKGVGKGVIDLLVDSEKTANKLGIQKHVVLNVLRSGEQ